MEIKAQQVKALREKTGAGMMDCKKALVETNGDEEKAIDLLREKGILKAAKKSDRIAAEGLVDIYISDDKKVGAIIEVNSETDFVARNEEFRTFVKDLVKQVADENPADVEALLNSESAVESGKLIKDVLTEKIATIGENLSIRRFERFETEGVLGQYIHMGGTIGVLVDTDCASEEVGEDICMQITAEKPELQGIVCEAMEYSLMAGGKRLRPVLCLEFYRMCGGKDIDNQKLQIRASTLQGRTQ